MSKEMAYLVGLEETAEVLGVSVYTVRRLVAAGSLPAVNIGTRVMISSETIERVQREGVRTQKPSTQRSKRKAVRPRTA